MSLPDRRERRLSDTKMARRTRMMPTDYPVYSSSPILSSWSMIDHRRLARRCGAGGIIPGADSAVSRRCWMPELLVVSRARAVTPSCIATGRTQQPSSFGKHEPRPPSRCPSPASSAGTPWHAGCPPCTGYPPAVWRATAASRSGAGLQAGGSGPDHKPSLSGSRPDKLSSFKPQRERNETLYARCRGRRQQGRSCPRKHPDRLPKASGPAPGGLVAQAGGREPQASPARGKIRCAAKKAPGCLGSANCPHGARRNPATLLQLRSC